MQVVLSSLVCCLILLLSAPATAASATADPLNSWQSRVSASIDYPARRIAFGNGTFVAVGHDYGHMLTSHDGATWSAQDSGTGTTLFGVAFGRGLFVVVGQNGVILTSTNGSNWTPQSSPVAAELRGVTFDGNRYFAVGASETKGLILSSLDAVHWQVQTLSAGPLFDVTFGNGLLVAVGDLGATAASVDGNTWQVGNSGPANSVFSVAYGAGRFIGVGYRAVASGSTGVIVTSRDGINWIVQAQDATVWSAAYGQGLYVAGRDDGGFLTSPDGVNWTKQSCCSSHPITALAYVQENFVALGGNFGRPGFDGVALSSTDGVHWSCHSRARRPWQDLAYANGRFVVVAGGSNYPEALGMPPPESEYGGILTSDNWALWNSCTQSSLAGAFFSVSYGNGTFVAVGQQTYTSADGLAWTPQSGLTNALVAVAYGRGAFVALGSHSAHRSTNGSGWTTTPMAASLQKVAYVNGHFLAVGDSMWGSLNGITWTQVHPDPPLDLSRATLTGVAYGNGVYVVVGYDASPAVGISQGEPTVLVSADGTVWSKLRLDASLPDVRAVTFAAGLFVAVGPGGIFTSMDGRTWTKRTTIPGTILRSVLFAQNSFFAVGDAGVVLQSGSLAGTLQLFARRETVPTDLELEVRKLSGATVRIQTSTNLQTWSDWQTVTDPGPNVILSDPAGTHQMRKFYRGVSP